MTAHDDAPLTSRSGSAQMHERPANFPTAGEAHNSAMQNLQEPVETGKGSAPSSGRSSFVISLLRTLRGVYMPTDEKLVLVVLADHAGADGVSFPSQDTIARETGLGLTKLGDALRALAKHGWLTRHRELDGGRVWMHTVYHLRLDGQAWPPPCRAARGGKPRSDRQPSGTDSVNRPTEAQPPDGETVNRGTEMRQPSHGETVNRRAPTKPPEEKLTDQAHRREAPIAPAQARVGDPPAPGQALLFEASAGTTPLPASGERPKEGKPPKAQDRYLAAFVAGIEDAGHRITLPRSSDGTHLGRICASHARRGDTAIVDDELVAWIRREVSTFRKAIDPRYCKVSVHGFGEWLDKGRPTQAPTFRPSEVDEDEGLPPVPLTGWSKPKPPPEVPPERLAANLRAIRIRTNQARAARGDPPLDLETGEPIVEAAHG